MDEILLSGVVMLALLGFAVLAIYLVIRQTSKNRAIGIGLLTLLVISTLYNVYDNNRIVVKQQVVYLENLTPAYEDFKILQISDLHGKSFGPGQVNLIAQVNGIDHDLIAFTGDMETASGSFAPFIALLNGIADKENLFYVNGNDDLAFKFLTGIKTEAGKDLEAHGCILLTQPYPIKRDGKTLWLGNDLTKVYGNFDVYQGIPELYFASRYKYQAYKEHFAELEAVSAPIKNNGDIKIALTHIPFTPVDLEQPRAQAAKLDYDLILAGHYHGGQFRIPFYGAPFIPIAKPFRDSFFPDQKWVSGLVESNGIQQYVSRGLGASSVPFRLFNTPEINLIILKAK